MRNYFIISFISVLFTLTTSESCDKCVKREQCTAYGSLSKKEQDSWDIKYPCSTPKSSGYDPIFGFDSTAKGDYVCCSNGISSTATTTESIAAEGISVDNRHPNYNRYGPQNNYDSNGYNFPTYNRPNTNWLDNNWIGNNNGYDQGNPYGYQPEQNRPPKNYFNTNNNPYVTPSPFFPVHGHGNGANGNLGGQCPVTRFPPKPETGCCGREASDPDRIIGKQPKPLEYNNNPPLTDTPNLGPGNGRLPNSYDNSAWPSWSPGFSNFNSPVSRVARSADDTVSVSIGDRIAGGRETELEQFPWTVLLQVTFDYGDKRAAFNCGGSLISSRYVLTAGHCVFDKGGKITDIDVYLAEYDKRTFPKDCKIVLGQGKKCIENVVMKAEDVVLHPQYDDTRLSNDIALIRLLGDAPYTDYIRPICLPTIDIDTPEFFNLRLAVAGWGRNGRYRSNIKQSTIVNLVTQEKCKKYYPNLSRGQVCAAGYTGEDTCKGDSGGPLMTVYGGKYEVVGVVSGKRADSPCGTSVPSLYTNVYHYRDWIQSNMKN